MVNRKAFHHNSLGHHRKIIHWYMHLETTVVSSGWAEFIYIYIYVYKKSVAVKASQHNSCCGKRTLRSLKKGCAPSPQCVCHLALVTVLLDHTLLSNPPVHLGVVGIDSQRKLWCLCVRTHTNTRANMGQRARGERGLTRRAQGRGSQMVLQLGKWGERPQNRQSCSHARTNTHVHTLHSRVRVLREFESEPNLVAQTNLDV